MSPPTVYQEKVRRDAIVSLVERLNNGSVFKRQTMFDEKLLGKSWVSRAVRALVNEGLIRRGGTGSVITYIRKTGDQIVLDENLIQRLLHPGDVWGKKLKDQDSLPTIDIRRFAGEEEGAVDASVSETASPIDPIAMLLAVPAAIEHLNQRLNLIEGGMISLLEKVTELHNEFFPGRKRS